MVSTPKFSRFSMCNCLTIRMDRISKNLGSKSRTYTAHLMTPSVFLKYAAPGRNFTVPFCDFWSGRDHIRTYAFPERITTFLLSPFNEIFHENYLFSDQVRYAIPLRFKNSDKLKGTKNVGHIPVVSYRKIIKRLDQRVTDLYPGALKVLVLYDYSRAPDFMKRRAVVFHRAVKAALRWPVIQLRDKKPPEDNSWQHYSTSAYSEVLNRLEELEKAHEG